MKFNALFKAAIISAILATSLSLHCSAASSVVEYNGYDVSRVINLYPNLSISENDPDYPFECNSFTYEGKSFVFYGKTRGACASAGIIASEPKDYIKPLTSSSQTNPETPINEQPITKIIKIFVLVLLIISASLVVIPTFVSIANKHKNPKRSKNASIVAFAFLVVTLVCAFAYGIISFVLVQFD